jgi:hypothetical protein
LIEQSADMLAFLVAELHMQVTVPEVTKEAKP